MGPGILHNNAPAHSSGGLILAERLVLVLSLPAYSSDLPPANFSIFCIKHYDGRVEIRSCFIYPAPPDERTEGDTVRRVFSDILSVV
jgi:hypothetical protein